MVGYQSILSMRRKGFRPAVVFVEVCADEPPWARDWQETFSSIATVWVGPDDYIGQLDFRFCRGLVVAVTADDEARGADVVAAIEAVDPQQVMLWTKANEPAHG